MANEHIVKGTRVNLRQTKTALDSGLTKEEAKARIDKLEPELYELQELLFAAKTHSLLIILQGMDTSGKEGAIGAISKATNVHGVRVTPFKQPTEEELDHDFLWRIHQHTPGKGMIGIFNRSHYEDVLVVRVHNLVPKPTWSKRYDQINEFEELLAENHTIILKFFLHISKEEQEERLRAREEDPVKAWKLSVGDWKERAFWNDYQRAYQEAIVKTNTKHAPWHIIPADNKWYRDLYILQTLIATLKPYRKHWLQDLAQEGKKELAEINAFRRTAKKKQ